MKEGSEQPVILAIESSCDETAAAILKNGKVLSNIVNTQKVHEQYGGVVPELASRAHMQHLIPVIKAAFDEAGVEKKEVDAVAFSHSPGLIGSLLVGAGFAKSFAQALQIPLIAVPHVKAHILAHFIDDPQPQFPFLCLTVSGGHTQLVICKNHLEHEIIGATIDDAAGEAFDKISKMIGLPYPGGPILDQLASTGNPKAYEFPIPSMEGYNYSFSGIKTAVLYFVQKQLQTDPQFLKNNINDVCASVQYTIVQTLMKKLEKAAKAFNIKHVGIAGGVSANSGLRAAIEVSGKKLGWSVYIPKFEYCTDNAAMIGIAAHYQYKENDFAPLTIVPSAKTHQYA